MQFFLCHLSAKNVKQIVHFKDTSIVDVVLLEKCVDARTIPVCKIDTFDKRATRRILRSCSSRPDGGLLKSGILVAAVGVVVVIVAVAAQVVVVAVVVGGVVAEAVAGVVVVVAVIVVVVVVVVRKRASGMFVVPI